MTIRCFFPRMSDMNLDWYLLLEILKYWITTSSYKDATLNTEPIRLFWILTIPGTDSSFDPLLCYSFFLCHVTFTYVCPLSLLSEYRAISAHRKEETIWRGVWLSSLTAPRLLKNWLQSNLSLCLVLLLVGLTLTEIHCKRLTFLADKWFWLFYCCKLRTLGDKIPAEADGVEMKQTWWVAQPASAQARWFSFCSVDEANSIHVCSIVGHM